MNDVFPFKITTLLEQCGTSPDIAAIILDEFLIQLADDMQEIESCIASRDWPKLGKAGHRLKGSAGVVGAEHLREICHVIEIAGKEGNAEKVTEIFAELQAESKRCVDAVPEAKTQLG